MNYYIAPVGWDTASANPFTPDGTYGWNWSAFCLLDQNSDQFFTGKSGNGPFSARFGGVVPRLRKRLADFLRYENAHNRSVILSFPGDIDIDTYVYDSLSTTPAENILRDEDPAIIVHATSQIAWEQILAGGCLLAASLLPKHPHMSDPVHLSDVERYLQDEPPEYKEYIMFAEMGSTTPERVTASYQAGVFASDETTYLPGVRLYFDNRKIIQDRLGVRDGLHTIKVHHRLPLSPYLLGTACVRDCDPQGQITTWTPRSFVETADKLFSKNLSAKHIT